MEFVCDMTRSNDGMQCRVKVLKMASSDRVYLLRVHVTQHGRWIRTEKEGEVSSNKHTSPKFSIY